MVSGTEGFIGPSGSGKTTLLRCMNLLKVPDSGSISVANRVLFIDEGPLMGKRISPKTY